MKRSSATLTSISDILRLGHRGAARYAPENTIAAFELALKHGCDGFEFDVRRTGDGRAVICHDRGLRGLVLARSSYSELVAIAPELPLLEQVLERFAARAFLDIELKDAGVEVSTAEAVKRWPPARGFVVSSFLPEVISTIRRLAESIPVGFITEKREQLASWARLAPDFMIPKYPLVGPRLVDEVHAAGKKLLTWTVNDENMMRRMAEIGVDGIISDDTRLLSRTVRGSR